MENTDSRQYNETSKIKTACGGMLDDTSGYPSAVFRGEVVYFCNHACLNAYLKAPDAFMAGEIEHPIEDAEKNPNKMEKLK